MFSIKTRADPILDLSVLSRKFCSGEKFGPGPKFSGRIVPVRDEFFEKSGPVPEILFRVKFFVFTVSCMLQ